MNPNLLTLNDPEHLSPNPRINDVSIHTAGWCTKNRYVNICIYVDSLWLFAASSPTGVVAQLGVRWIALLRFLGLNPGG